MLIPVKIAITFTLRNPPGPYSGLLVGSVSLTAGIAALWLRAPAVCYSSVALKDAAKVQPSILTLASTGFQRTHPSYNFPKIPKRTSSYSNLPLQSMPKPSSQPVKLRKWPTLYRKVGILSLTTDLGLSHSRPNDRMGTIATQISPMGLWHYGFNSFVKSSRLTTLNVGNGDWAASAK